MTDLHKAIQAGLNVASQCRATASSPLASQILVDGGNGLLKELLIDAARAIECALAAQPEPGAIPKNLDVRTIMLDVVPGPDGGGQEVYATCVADVERVLTDMGERLENCAAAPTPPQPEPVVGWHPFPKNLQNPDGRLLRTAADLLERSGHTGVSKPLREMADALLSALPTPPQQKGGAT